MRLRVNFVTNDVQACSVGPQKLTHFQQDQFVVVGLVGVAAAGERQVVVIAHQVSLALTPSNGGDHRHESRLKTACPVQMTN